MGEKERWGGGGGGVDKQEANTIIILKIHTMYYYT